MASRVPVTVTVNGQQHVGEVEPRQLLATSCANHSA